MKKFIVRFVICKNYICGKGYILQKKELRDPSSEDYFLSNQEFHPTVFLQMRGQPIKEFDTFDQAIDEFYSSQESQKIDLKAIQQVSLNLVNCCKIYSF